MVRVAVGEERRRLARGHVARRRAPRRAGARRGRSGRAAPRRRSARARSSAISSPAGALAVAPASGALATSNQASSCRARSPRNGGHGRVVRPARRGPRDELEGHVAEVARARRLLVDEARRPSASKAPPSRAAVRGISCRTARRRVCAHVAPVDESRVRPERGELRRVRRREAAGREPRPRRPRPGRARRRARARARAMAPSRASS